jgi:hypothetical protein
VEVDGVSVLYFWDYTLHDYKGEIIVQCVVDVFIGFAVKCQMPNHLISSHLIFSPIFSQSVESMRMSSDARGFSSSCASDWGWGLEPGRGL